ncbi:MAG: cytochrome c [Pseudomonadota bacterium]
MRALLVRIMAFATATLMLLLAFTFAWLHHPAPPGELSGAVQAGRAVYQTHGCALCHAIGGEGNPRTPLDGVGARRDAAQIRDWILATGEAEGALPAPIARVKSSFRTLGEEDLAALVAYLQSLPPRD